MTGRGTALVERLDALVRWELAVALVVASVAAWALTRALAPRWSTSRGELLAAKLGQQRGALTLAVGCLGARLLARWAGVVDGAATVALGLLVVVAWSLVGLGAARLLLFLWLFAHSTREGVPLLLVDLFTILASVVAFCGVLHEVFLIEVASLLAGSAVASIVLGLALQDTLGHLFAGVALQLDRPFRLGDWIEVRVGAERYAGQVLEVSWRATSLLAIGEELVAVPNKLVSQGVVSNFSGRERPFVRAHLFRVRLDSPLDVVKDALLEAARATPGIVCDPAPVPLIIETTESWVAVKMITFITDYGRQFTTGDAYHHAALTLLAARGVELAGARLQVTSTTP